MVMGIYGQHWYTISLDNLREVCPEETKAVEVLGVDWGTIAQAPDGGFYESDNANKITAAVAAAAVAKDAYSQATADAAQAAANADAAAEAKESAAAAYWIAEKASTEAFAALKAALKAHGVRGNF